MKKSLSLLLVSLAVAALAQVPAVGPTSQSTSIDTSKAALSAQSTMKATHVSKPPATNWSKIKELFM
jgi:Tfp pilus assembly protein PilV